MIIASTRVDVQDEGVSQGRTLTLNFVGAGVSAAVASGVATITITGGAGAGFTFTVVEKDLGSAPRYGGTFDITGLVGLTVNKSVLIQQAVGPYTNKGDRQDEAEMDQALVTAYVFDATTIRCYWQTSVSNGPIAGNVKFQYAVSG